jgi:hypothetical protein
MKKLLTGSIILLLLLALTPSLGLAQSGTQLASLKVSFWSEYDRPGVLVLYEARLPEDVEVPTTMRIPVPDNVDSPHAVAALFPDGQLDDNVEWKVVREGSAEILEVETPTTGVWIEYYAPLDVQGADRRFEFLLPSGLEIADLIVEVLHPVGASDVVINPAGTAAQNTSGLVTTTIDLGARSEDEAQEITLSYRKASSTLLSTPRQETSPPPLEALEVALWPEYDQPSMLVFLRGALSPSVELPAHVEIPVPAAYGEPSAVAVTGVDGQLLAADYQRQVQGDWATINMDLEAPGLWIEFYVDLSFDDELRSFTYFWPGGMDIGEFIYEIQQPWGATVFQLTPPGAADVHSDGLLYHRASYGTLTDETQALISLAYAKESSELTINAQPKIDRPDEVRGETQDFSKVLPIIIGVVGLVLIAAGVIVYLRFKKQDEEVPQPRKRQRRRKTSGAQMEDVDASPVYCHICGAQASASDHYCRRCGAELRQ